MQITPQKRPTTSSALQCLWFESSDQNSGVTDLKVIKNELQQVETGLRTQHRTEKTVSDSVALASNETLRQHPRQWSFDANSELGRDHREILQDSNPAADREEISTKRQRRESDLTVEVQGTLEEEQDLETEVIIKPEDVLALHNAASEGDKELVYQLLKKGVNIEAKQDSIVPKSRSSFLPFELTHCRQTALHKAARQGHEAVVSLLLKLGANIEAMDYMDGQHGWRPLHYAVMGGHTGTAQALLDGGANIESPGWFEARPLDIAIELSWIGTINLLLERRADMNAKGFQGDTPLQMVGGKDKKMAEILLNAGAEMDVMDVMGRTPLMNAVSRDNLELAILLLESGAEVNAKDDNRNSPLIKAVERGHLDLICLLLEQGADVNMTNHNERSALHSAVNNAWFYRSENCIRIVEKLLENGADPQLKSNNGVTPLDIAEQIGQGLPKVIRKGREEYLSRTQPTAFAAGLPREDKASLPYRHRDPTIES